jgi:hypothetical protein
MTTTKETITLETLEQMMKRHDWLYGYADDYNAFSKGASAEARLVEACRDLSNAGHAEEVARLWTRYCPEEARKWM